VVEVQAAARAASAQTVFRIECITFPLTSFVALFYVP
jgi:hypothetical protein